MRISARGDYAVQATIELALHTKDELLTSEQIAEEQGIPMSFLEGILTTLRKAGIVESRRGAGGGFQLARPAEEITVADVIRAVEGPLVYVRDTRPSETRYASKSSNLVDLWVALRASVREVLEGTTLAALVSGEFSDRVSALIADPESWLHRSPHDA